MKKKIFLLMLFAGTFLIWTNAMALEEREFPDRGAENCKDLWECSHYCKNGQYYRIKGTGINGKEAELYCVLERAVKDIGSPCTKHEDCVEEAYCYPVTKKCVKKLPDNEQCDDWADTGQDLCAYGCASNTVYKKKNSTTGVTHKYCGETKESTDTNPVTGPGAPATPSNLSGMKIPGTTESGGIIKCGRGGQNMCTLCDLIEGFNNIIQYIMKIAIGVALVAIAIGGILYTVSAGDSGAAEKAKTTIKNALIGFIIVFSAWLIVNTTISAIGAKKDLGISVTGWGEFDCNASKGTGASTKK